jgi:hypothetical protein
MCVFIRHLNLRATPEPAKDGGNTAILSPALAFVGWRICCSPVIEAVERHSHQLDQE